MLNKVTLIGNVGKEPEIRSMQDGKEVANFSLATSESYKDKSGERQTKTEWHKVVVFNAGLVKVIQQYVKKGSKLYLEGQLHTRKWTDKDGNDQYTTEVILQPYRSELKLLDSKDTNLSPPQGGDNSPPPLADNELNDEVPF